MLRIELSRVNPSGPGEIAAMTSEAPVVGIVMGSRSDWPTMQAAAVILNEFDVPHECRVVSAHRTPDWMAEYGKSAQSRGLKLIVAGAGGAAHLPGMLAAHTVLPVLGVPIKSRALNGLDSLLSIVQMPGGVPVGTMAIGESGAKNAALLALRILGISDRELQQRVSEHHAAETERVLRDSELCLE